MENEKINLPLVFLVSFLLSLFLYLRPYIISLDGAFQYIPLAKNFVSGSFQEGLRGSGQQPLYSFLIALLYQWIPDFEIAGRLVAFFFGVLIIFPVYFLGRRIFDQRTAFFSTLLLSLHPYIRRFSADVLKESTYLFFLATAIWFSWRTIEGQKKYLYLLIPFLSVLAYLVRPDGVEILLVVFFYILLMKRFNISRERQRVILLLLLSSALLLLPYLIYLRESTGTWTLSRTKSFSDFFGFGWAGENISILLKTLFTFKTLNSRFYAILHPFYLFLMAVGLSKKFSEGWREGEKFLISLFALHYIVLSLLILNITDWEKEVTPHAVLFSGRHVLPFLIFSIYWMGEGFVSLYNWLDLRIWPFKSGLLSEPRRRSLLVGSILCLLVLAIILPKTLKPQRQERLPEKWAGLWIKSHYGKGAAIFTTIPRVAFYADGHHEYIDLKKENMDKIRNSMIEKKALFLVFRDVELPFLPQIMTAKDFVDLNRFGGKGLETVIIYYKKAN